MEIIEDEENSETEINNGEPHQFDEFEEEEDPFGENDDGDPPF